jgi:hypothetical protein
MNFIPGEWKVFGGTVELQNKEMQVDHVDVEITVHDTTSRDEENQEMPIYFTDLQFQPGHQKTGWIPGMGVRPDTKEMVGEFLDRIEFDIDEIRKYKLANGSLDPFYQWKTVSPAQYTSAQLGHKRIFNILGRGHEIITLPNDLPEEKFWRPSDIKTQGLDRPVEILSTGIDFTLIPKDSFDLCRIATNSGSALPEDQWIYKDVIDKYAEQNPNGILEIQNHPLHKRYTREFWFTAGNEGDILEVNATTMTARKNGSVVERNGIRQITIGGHTLEIYKNKFHLIPRGSVRFRIEFYKSVPMEFLVKDETGAESYETVNILKDTGVGYTGIAKFLQWTYGKERL